MHHSVTVGTLAEPSACSVMGSCWPALQVGEVDATKGRSQYAQQRMQKCFFFLRSDGLESDFSVNKCIEGLKVRCPGQCGAVCCGGVMYVWCLLLIGERALIPTQKPRTACARMVWCLRAECVHALLL